MANQGWTRVVWTGFGAIIAVMFCVALLTDVSPGEMGVTQEIPQDETVLEESSAPKSVPVSAAKAPQVSLSSTTQKAKSKSPGTFVDECPPYFKKVETRHKTKKLNACGKWYHIEDFNRNLADSLKQSVRFVPNKVTLTEEGKHQLDKVAKILIKHPSIKVTVLGMTPEHGKPGRILGDGRAVTSSEYLRKHGVNNTISAHGVLEAKMIGIQIHATGSSSLPRPAGCSRKKMYDVSVKYGTTCVPNHERDHKTEETKLANEKHAKERAHKLEHGLACPPGYIRKRKADTMKKVLTACGKWYRTKWFNEELDTKLASTVRFVANAKNLTAGGKHLLGEVAKTLKMNPTVAVDVTGETPLYGKQGKELAEGRASAAADFLKHEGVTNKITIAAHTDTKVIGIHIQSSEKLGSKPAGCTDAAEDRFKETDQPLFVCQNPDELVGKERHVKLQKGLICPGSQVRKTYQYEVQALNACGLWYQHTQVDRQLASTLQHTVHFKPNSVKLEPKGRVVLQKVAEVLRKNPSEKISVVGKTPLEGTAGNKLGAGRANATVDYLREHGVHNEMWAFGQEKAKEMAMSIQRTHAHAAQPEGCTLATRYTAERKETHKCISERQSKAEAKSEAANKEKATKKKKSDEHSYKVKMGLICKKNQVRKTMEQEVRYLSTCGKWYNDQEVNVDIAKAVQKTVKYEPNSVELTKEGKHVLTQVAHTLSKSPTQEISVIGETPLDEGMEGHKLSQGRAVSATEFLKKLGCTNKIHARGETGQKEMAIVIRVTGENVKPKDCNEESRYKFKAETHNVCVSAAENAKKEELKVKHATEKAKKEDLQKEKANKAAEAAHKARLNREEADKKTEAKQKSQEKEHKIKNGLVCPVGWEMRHYQSEERYLTPCGHWFTKHGINKKVRHVMKHRQVFFHHHKTELTDDGEDVLDKVAHLVKFHPSKMLSITASTRATGDFGQKLGIERARAVEEHLKKHGAINPVVLKAQEDARSPEVHIFAQGGVHAKKPIGCDEQHRVRARMVMKHKCVNLHLGEKKRKAEEKVKKKQDELAHKTEKYDKQEKKVKMAKKGKIAFERAQKQELALERVKKSLELQNKQTVTEEERVKEKERKNGFKKKEIEEKEKEHDISEKKAKREEERDSKSVEKAKKTAVEEASSKKHTEIARKRKAQLLTEKNAKKAEKKDEKAEKKAAKAQKKEDEKEEKAKVKKDEKQEKKDRKLEKKEKKQEKEDEKKKKKAAEKAQKAAEKEQKKEQKKEKEAKKKEKKMEEKQEKEESKREEKETKGFKKQEEIEKKNEVKSKAAEHKHKASVEVVMKHKQMQDAGLHAFELAVKKKRQTKSDAEERKEKKLASQQEKQEKKEDAKELKKKREAANRNAKHQQKLDEKSRKKEAKESMKKAKESAKKASKQEHASKIVAAKAEKKHKESKSKNGIGSLGELRQKSKELQQKITSGNQKVSDKTEQSAELKLKASKDLKRYGSSEKTNKQLIKDEAANEKSLKDTNKRATAWDAKEKALKAHVATGSGDAARRYVWKLVPEDSLTKKQKQHIINNHVRLAQLQLQKKAKLPKLVGDFLHEEKKNAPH